MLAPSTLPAGAQRCSHLVSRRLCAPLSHNSFRPLRKATIISCAAAAGGGSSPIDQAKDAASKAKAGVEDFASKVVGKDVKIPTPKLDVDLKSLITWNFIAQFFLTAVSWAVVFFTSHAQMAKGVSLNPTTGILLVGVALAGYSAYQSYTYFAKTKAEGLGVLEGWAQLQQFYDHITLNVIGSIATILALQAEVGSLMMTTMTSSTAAALKLKAETKAADLATEALAQASANTLLAHLVSLTFLIFMTRKITDAYKKLLDWSKELRASLPSF